MVLISKQQSKQACFFLSSVHPRSLNPRAIKKTALFEGELLRTSVISTRGMDSLNCQWLQEWGRGNEAYSTHNLLPNPWQGTSLWENSSGHNQERVGKPDETTQLEAMPHALLSCCENLMLPCTFYHGGGGLVAMSCLTLATPQTVACQAPLSTGFSRQEYWRILVAVSFSRGSSQARDQTRDSCIAGRLSTYWTIREVPFYCGK